MTSDISRTSVPTLRPAVGSHARSMWGWALSFVQAAFVVAAERHQLSSLDDHLLKDIGLSRRLAEREVGRAFLDVPAERISRR